MKYYLFLILIIFLALPYAHNAQPGTSDTRVILLGNTGDIIDINQYFTRFENYWSKQNDSLHIILNGDLFPLGANDGDVESRISRILQMLDNHPSWQVVLNQGEIEWSNSSKGGWDRLRHLSDLVEKFQHPRLHTFLNQGCPGPWLLEASASLNLIIINSQWWNHPWEVPLPSMSICKIADEGIFLDELRDMLEETINKNTMILSHLPLESHGKFGGYHSFKDYFLPFPLVGSANVGFHQNIGSDQDICNEEFKQINAEIGDLLREHSSVVFASGHDRSMEIFREYDNFYINSGAPVKSEKVGKSYKTISRSQHPGATEVLYKSDGSVNYQMHTTGKNGEFSPSHTGQIMGPPCEKNEQHSVVNTAYSPCFQVIAPSDQMAGDYATPALVMAGQEYKAGKSKEFWLGRHWRRSWTQPVTIPYLNLDTAFKGLTIYKKGGGRQTTSLKMKANDGKEYVFRSVNKNPEKSINYAYRGTLISEVLRDQTTTQHPFGALPADYLLNKLDILHAHPKLYILPPDNKLGSFKKEYKNLFGMLEDRPTDNVADDKIFAEADDITKSYRMFGKLYDDPDSYVDTKEFARARVFDILVGDWGKHEDNWKWAEYDFKGGKRFRPIPRDRDHVFSQWDGVLPWLADREWAKPSGENFDHQIKGLRSLMWQARHLDRLLANELTKEDWIKAAQFIQENITESAIEKAVRTMPSEIYDPDGMEIERKLKSRLKDLANYAEQYYLILARVVNVVGSNKAEHFLAERLPDGKVRVIVRNIGDKTNLLPGKKTFYQRTFDPSETKEIRLFGLSKRDVFIVQGDVEKSIKIRLIGGPGNDVYEDNSTVKNPGKRTIIYENDTKPIIKEGTETKMARPKELEYYFFDRTEFTYNTYFPTVVISQNPFSGLIFRAGVQFTRQAYGKPDYSTIHNLSAAITTQSNYELAYSARRRYMLGTWDGIFAGLISRPLNYNFFHGVGNETENDKSLDRDFYRTQYNTISLRAGLSHEFWEKSMFALTANYENNDGIERNDNILGDLPDQFGNQKLNMYYLDAELSLDFRDGFALPEKGFRFVAKQEVGTIDESSDDFFSRTELLAEQYLTNFWKNPLTLGVKAGGDHSSGELPFYKLFTLGQTNDLKGFNSNRFSGESRAFLNTELRLQLWETENVFIPAKVGIRGFFDIGRVWADSDPSGADRWHQGYGGGIYVVPFNERIALNLTFGSSEEESFLFMFSLGSLFR